MKLFKILYLILTLFLANNSYSQLTNEPGIPTFGAELSISLSNNVISRGSTVLLQCISTNCSTNGICFIQTDSRLMYTISVFGASGKEIELNNAANTDNSPQKGNRINFSESYKCLVPIKFNGSIPPGKYKIFASQRIFIFMRPNRQDIRWGELVSAPIDVNLE